MNSGTQRGVAAVEFAIVAPLLFVLLFGIIEFSVVLFDQAMLTNASREGARQGIVYNRGTPFTDAQIQGIVSTYLIDGGNSRLISLGGTSAHTTTIARGGTGAGAPLTVTVNYTYTFLVLRPLVALLGGTLPGTLNLGATTVMRME